MFNVHENGIILRYTRVLSTIFFYVFLYFRQFVLDKLRLHRLVPSRATEKSKNINNFSNCCTTKLPYPDLQYFDEIGETIGIGTWNTKQIVDTYLFGCFVVVDPSPIKKESKRGYWNTYSFRVRLLQLSHLSCHLYSKMDFIRVLSNNF